MRRFVGIGLFVTAVVIASAFNSFGRCAGESSVLLKINDSISSNGVAAGCQTFGFAETTGNLLGLSKVQASPENSSPDSRLKMTVIGRSSLVVASPPQWIKGTDKFDFGDVHGIFQIACGGATSPRISWGPTRFYYSAPFQENGTLIEADALRTGGIGEADQAGYTIKGENVAAAVGGSSVFPITEYISRVDLDNLNESAVIKNVMGETRTTLPNFVLIGPIKNTETGEELDKEKLPVNTDLSLCMGINVHPAGGEIYRITLDDGRIEKILKTVAVQGHTRGKVAFNDEPVDLIPDGSGWTTCFDNLRLAKPQLYDLQITWLPYDMKSNPLRLRGVKNSSENNPDK